MPTSIIWTALPNGIGANNRMKLSVYIAPRLSGGARETTLDEFKLFHDWPAQVARFQKQIKIRYGATEITPAAFSPLPNSEVWTNLFSTTTLVRSFGWVEYQSKLKAYSEKRIRSYDVNDVHETIREKYTKVAVENPINPPTAARHVSEENLGLIGFYGGMASTKADPSPETKFFAQIDNTLKTVKVMPKLQLRSVNRQVNPVAMKLTFAQVKQFYLRPEMLAVRRQPAKVPPPLPPPPVLDFHEQLGAMGSYPYMLRQCGIVIDLEFTLPPNTPPATEVQVIPPSIPGVSLPPVTPKTKIGANFLPTPNPASQLDISNGMLNLGLPKYRVVMLDVDGAALNLMEFATNMQRKEHRRMKQGEKTMIAEADTNPDFAAYCSANPQVAQGNLTASATALPVSHKMVISQSLLAKAVKMEEEPLPALRSAGISVIKTRRAEATAQKLDRQLILHQKIAAPLGGIRAVGAEEVLWADDLVRGYAVDVFSNATSKWHSLCARVGAYDFMDAPGKTIQNISDEAAVEMAGTEDNESKHLYVHESVFRWTGWSLAVPRPGKSLDDKSNLQGKADRVKYQKGLRLSTEFKVPPGSMPKLRYGSKYKIRARVVDLAGNTVGFSSALANNPGVATKEITYTRYAPVSAPQISLCAEPKPSESTMHLVIRSNYNTPLYEPDTQRYITPPPGTEGMAEEHGRLDGAQGMLADKLGAKTYDVVRTHDGTLRDLKIAQNPAITKEPQQDEPPLIFPPGSLTSIPFLPDPLAEGAMLRNLPSAGARKAAPIPFAAQPNWFDAKPFRIRLVEGSADPVFDPGQRVLTVSLPKAERFDDVFVSSIPVGAAVDYMGVTQWLAEMNVPQIKRVEIINYMRQGLHWMTSPHLSLSVVHAIQQPLVPPKFGALTSNREIGDTYTVLSDTNLSVHGKSTLKLDIEGAWKEWVDNPRRGKPVQIDRKAIAFDLNVLRHQTAINLPVDPPSRRELILLTQVIQLRPQAINPSPKQGYRHEFHDTKHRMVSYKAIGMTRFKDYFADKVGLKDEDFQRESTPVNVNVRNSARPDAPKIAYIIPAFGWTKTKQGASVTSNRSGGGLRVYLERPWYSSGNGEKLAVVLMRDALSRPKIDTHISLWGKDPVWRTPSRRVSELNTGDFPLMSKDRGLQGIQLSQQAIRFDTKVNNTAFNTAFKTPTTIKPQGSLVIQPADAKINPALVALFGNRITLAEFNDDPDMAVLVAPHDVAFDESRNLWYCDIEINMPAEYFPFVRLALARYQHNSLEHCHLSRVVRAEFIQLTPERTVSITPAGNTGQQFTVTHTGVTYDSARKTGDRAFIAPQAGPNLIRVTVEQKRADGGGSLGWSPVAGEPYELDFVMMSGANAVHRQIVTVPGDRSNFRLVVQEFEMHFGGDEMLRPESQGRLIYADAIEL